MARSRKRTNQILWNECSLYDANKKDLHLIQAAAIAGINYGEKTFNYQLSPRQRAGIIEQILTHYPDITFTSNLLNLIFESHYIYRIWRSSNASFPNLTLYFSFRYRRAAKALEYCLFWKPQVNGYVIKDTANFPTKLIWKRHQDFWAVMFPSQNRLEDWCSKNPGEHYYCDRNLIYTKVKLTKGEKKVRPFHELIHIQ
ncbi:MAG: hypothetical protein F6K55_03345 [Moorea sp. SIO4A3]|nr:hypothetical protein [Moorena sp. SIO4A3]